MTFQKKVTITPVDIKLLKKIHNNFGMVDAVRVLLRMDRYGFDLQTASRVIKEITI